jgi:hypothetical protein
MTHILDLFHATAAMRTFVNRKALEDLFGAQGAGRVARPIEWENERTRGASRYRRRVDLRVPAPRTQRPQNADGRTTTHVSIEVVRKVAAPATVSGNGASSNGALAYSNYVTDPAKVGNIAYLTEPKTEVEPGSDEHRVAAFVSNIGTDRATLEAYWNRRWEEGRNTGEYRFELFSDRGSADDWQSLADAGDTPPRIARTAARIALLRNAGRSPKRRVLRRLGEDVLLWSDGLGERFPKKKDKPILHFAKPRCARVQTKIVFEFDERLTAAERLHVLNLLMSWLDGSGVRMLAVAHDPDANNDPRNFHPHVLIDPTIYPVEDNATVHGWGRKMRPGELAGILGYLPEDPPKGYWRLGKLDYQAVRQFIVAQGNDQLAKRGLEARFHAGSFAELGIDKKPNKHLGSKAAALVAVGALVERDYLNALNDWRFAIAQREADLARQQDVWSRFREDAREGVGCLAEDALKELEAGLVRHAALAATVAEQARALAHFDTLVDIARSAAERLKSKTGRIVDNLVSGGKVTAADRRNETQIRARHALATMHLSEIGEALAPYLPAIAAERMELAGGLSDLVKLERLVCRQIEAVKALSARQRWPEESVLAGPAYPDPLASRDHFDALVDHVLTQFSATSDVSRNSVVHVFRDAGTRELTATGLRSADAALVSDERFASRWAGVLQEADKRQRDAISRLSPFVEKHGRNRLILGLDGDGKPLRSTLQRLRDGLAGHPTLASELDRAERMYQQTGDNDHYRRLQEGTPGQAPGPTPAPGATVGGTSVPSRNADPGPRYVGERMDAPKIEATPVSAQTGGLAQTRPPTTVPVSAVPPVRAAGPAEPVATPAAPVQTGIASERPANGEGQQAVPPTDAVQAAPGPSSEVRLGHEDLDEPIPASIARPADMSTMQSLPPLNATPADRQDTEHHSSARVDAAEPAQIATPLEIPIPAPNDRPRQTGVSGTTTDPDATRVTPDKAVAHENRIVAPPAPRDSVRAEQAKEEGGTAPNPATTEAGREPVTQPGPTAVLNQEREAPRNASAAEILRRGLLNSPPPSAEGPATKPLPALPRSAIRRGKAPPPQPPRTPKHSLPRRADAVAAVLASHREGGSQVVAAMRYGEFEQRAAMFVAPISKGDLSIRLEAGEVQVGGIRSDSFHVDLQRFADDPAGWSLLARLASSLADKTLPGRGAQWTSMPTPSAVPEDWERSLQDHARDADRHR